MTLMTHAERMFDLEFVLKQKAQLKYLEDKQNRQWGSKLLAYFQHDFLWSPTPLYYLGAFLSYLTVKNRFKLKLIHLVPMFAIPVTLDYMKRDFYVKKFPKEYKELQDNQKVVQSIIKEKTSYVTFE